jgi:hypothetical protein
MQPNCSANAPSALLSLYNGNQPNQFGVNLAIAFKGLFRYHCRMPRKPKPKPDNPEQFKRFIDMAHEVGAEQPSPDFERVFRKVAEQPKRIPSKTGPRKRPTPSAEALKSRKTT